MLKGWKKLCHEDTTRHTQVLIRRAEERGQIEGLGTKDIILDQDKNQ
jgi:hypothetical protein